jgi:hypothetical protein
MSLLATSACSSGRDSSIPPDQGQDVQGSTEPSSAPLRKTEIITVTPWAGLDIADGYAIKLNEPEGACTGASGVSLRADAYRCTAQGIYDPCFLAPMQDDPSGPSMTEEEGVTRFVPVACPTSPDDIIQVDAMLPFDKRTFEGVAPEQGDIWMVILEDGLQCQGAVVAGPVREDELGYNMFCQDGKSVLWDQIDTTKPIWTILRSDSELGPVRRVNIAKAYH